MWQGSARYGLADEGEERYGLESCFMARSGDAWRDGADQLWSGAAVMIVRTEFSFRQTFGPIDECVSRLPAWGGAIADGGCWGHVPFAKACKTVGKRAVLGRRLSWARGWAVVLPRSPVGLRALYGHPGGELNFRVAADQDWFTLV